MPPGAEFVNTGEIPRLIADALHPLPDYSQFPVRSLEKRYWGEYVKRTGISFNTYKAPTLKVLTKDDRENLAKMWKHLPKLEYPIVNQRPTVSILQHVEIVREPHKI